MFKTIPFMLLLVAFMFSAPLAFTNSPLEASDATEIVASLVDQVQPADATVIHAHRAQDFTLIICPVEVGMAPCSCSIHQGIALLRGKSFMENQYELTRISRSSGNLPHLIKNEGRGETRASTVVLS